jgi:hypothetical protein
MDEQPEQREPAAKYRAPAYEAGDDAPWYHFLHGNVPGHQIDYIYQAKVPQGALERQHYAHLTRLLRFIEPQTTGEMAFAIGNLSRNDVQFVPGHGGLALIFGLRVHGVVDHAGRQDPPFAHAIVAVDRALDYGAILEAALLFNRRVLDRSADWYSDYVRLKTEEPEAVTRSIERYVARFDDLPSPAQSDLSLAWTIGEAMPPKRIVIAHDDEVEFGEVAYTAARIAAVLYLSDIKWTSISNGRDRESDELGKVTIRFLARSQIGPNETVVYDIEDLPTAEADLMAKLFKAESTAEPKATDAFPRRLSWEGSAPLPAPPPNPRAARTSEPGSMDVDVSMDEPPETATLPLSVRPPRMAPSQRPPPPMSERPEGDRAAMVEMLAVEIPRAAPIPVEMSSKAEMPEPAPSPLPAPVPVPAPPRQPIVAPASPAPVAVAAVAPTPAPTGANAPAPEDAPAGATRKFWLVIGGFVVAAGVVIGVLALQSGDPPTPPPLTTPSAAPSPTPAPTVPPAAVVTVEPLPTTAPAAQPSATGSAKPDAKKPGSKPAGKSSLLKRDASDLSH